MSRSVSGGILTSVEAIQAINNAFPYSIGSIELIGLGFPLSLFLKTLRKSFNNGH
ncbi:hypothetical protein CFPU101_33730 [Chroococcus sp. FPU101]|nr:hypothetical protein CFPU101_33730 [Chroococcus sp. FPU101]